MLHLVFDLPVVADDAPPHKKLEYYRELRGYTKEYMSEQMGISFGAYVNLEKNFNEIHEKEAEILAEILDIEPDVFTDDYMRFISPGYGERIARIRKCSMMTQMEFAEAIGVARATLSIWESEYQSEYRRPSREHYERIVALAEEINIDAEKLIEDIDAYTDEYADFIAENYGRKIRKIRYAYGMMFSEFAELLGCEANTLEQWEIEVHTFLRRYFPRLKELAEDKGIDLERLNENPDYFISEYEKFFNHKCGRKIKSIRCAYDMRLNEFCELIGCTDVALGKWENNRCVPEPKYYSILMSLAERKGITVEDLNRNPELWEDGYEEFLRSDYRNLIRDYRIERGLTQAHFAKKIGVSSSTVGYWENGRVVPAQKTYRLIMKEIYGEGGKQ